MGHSDTNGAVAVAGEELHYYASAETYKMVLPQVANTKNAATAANLVKKVTRQPTKAKKLPAVARYASLPRGVQKNPQNTPGGGSGTVSN